MGLLTGKKDVAKKTVAQQKDLSANPLFQLLLKELRLIYEGEKKLAAFFSDLLETCHTSSLKHVLEEHANQTKKHIISLEQLFSTFEVPLEDAKSILADTLIKELKRNIKGLPNSALKDTILIASLQKIQHYEIACYGTAKTYAHQLSLKAESETLKTILEEEIDTDNKLTSIAEGGFFTKGVNIIASQESKS